MSKQEETYQRITDRIIEALEAGDLKWMKSWSDGGLPQNLLSKKAYRGINAFIIAMHMRMNKFSQPYYLTFNQCRQLGGKVKKGSKGEVVTYFKPLPVCITCRKGKTRCECPEHKQKIRDIPLMKYYYVFNIEQIEGIKIPEQEKLDFTPIEGAEKLENAWKEELAEGLQFNEQSAYYNPGRDYINMPKKETFKSVEEYYAVLFHEMTHSTGHKTRLDREGVAKVTTFGDAIYSREEVIAELGSAFVCGYFKIEKAVLQNNAAYLQHWIQALRQDNKFIFKVATEAQKAADLLLTKIKEDKNESIEQKAEETA